MTVPKQTLKQKAVQELKEYLIMALYLFVVFSLLVLHTSVILGEHHINYALHGFALLNALALAKVLLAGQNLHLVDQFGDAPLVYPTVAKAFAFTVLLACFKIAEEATLGWFHGKSFHQSLANMGGGSWSGILILMALVFVMLIPFFGFNELRRVFGEQRLVGAFFRPRHLWALPPQNFDQPANKKLA